MGMIIKTNKWMRRQRKRKTFYPVKPIKHQTKMMVPEHFTVVFIRKILIQNLPKSIACSMGCLIRIKLWRLWRNWARKKNDFYTNIQITKNIKEYVFLLISARQVTLRKFYSTLLGAHLPLKWQPHSHNDSNSLVLTTQLRVFLKKSFYTLP